MVVAGVLAGDQVLAPVLDPLHRPAEALAGEHDRDLVGEHEHLLPEAAADVAASHADPVLGHAEGTREEPARRGALGRGVHDELPLRNRSQIDTTPRHSIGTHR